MKFLKYLAGIAMATALVACGGGGGGSTTSGGGGDGVKDPVAADFIFELDKTTIVNSGGDKAVLTVTVLDDSRNVVAGVPVSVAVNAGGVFTAISDSKTNTSGKFSGEVSIGGNKANRTISATIKAGTITKVASIVVTGSAIAVTPVPATPAPGQMVTLNISTTDSAQSPIQFASLKLSGTAGASGSVTTDASGNIITTFQAPASAGSYNVVVTGLGVSTTKVIEVVSTTGGGKPEVPAGVLVSSKSLNPLPTSILANLEGSTTNRSKLSAKFLTSGNAAIENMRVRFQIMPPVLGSGEAISTGNATVYTDASGVAESFYIAGTRTSPTNGVSVRACYKKTNFTDENDCPEWVDATLTVAGTPLSISISDDNTMSKGLGGIAYVKQFLIQVNDAAGVAIPDAVVSASVDIRVYRKGYWDTIADPVKQMVNYTCANEDTNRNGYLDLLEDVNGNGVLEPRKAEIIVSYVNGNKTDANGQLLVQISYGQNMGSWLGYTLRATTGVAGSEGDASKSYITGVLEGDMENGSFLRSPFGVNACDKPN